MRFKIYGLAQPENIDECTITSCTECYLWYYNMCGGNFNKLQFPIIIWNDNNNNVEYCMHHAFNLEV